MVRKLAGEKRMEKNHGREKIVRDIFNSMSILKFRLSQPDGHQVKVQFTDIIKKYLKFWN